MTKLTINVRQRYVDQPGRYEDRYGHYLKFFQLLAETWTPMDLADVPATWYPFCHYLGHTVNNTYDQFPSCPIVREMMTHYDDFPDKRHFVEVVSTFRPELVDALWKYDMQWDSNNARAVLEHGADILITNNGSYHRPEIMNYFDDLNTYKPTKRNVVLVPCAADKPYPAVMHQAVLDRMPASFYLANITGVIGVVPQDLWPVMPQYDSGIPNEWRLVDVAKDYFGRNDHDNIIVYIDFYSLALANAFQQLGIMDKVTWINPVGFYHDYLDLLDPTRLKKLELAFQLAETNA